MKTLALAALCLSFWPVAARAQSPAPWKTRTFAAPVDAVYTAAQKAITAMHELKSADPSLHVIRFHVGTTAWSWGYNMSLSVEDAGNGASRTSVEIEKSGGPALSWGSGKKEVGKIFDRMKKELAASRSQS